MKNFQKHFNKQINEYLKEVPKEYIPSNPTKPFIIQSKLFEEYHFSEIVSDEAKRLANIIFSKIRLDGGRGFEIDYKCKFFDTSFKVKLIGINNERDYVNPNFVENRKDWLDTKMIGVLYLSNIVGTSLPLYYLNILLTHEMTHIFQIYKIRKSANEVEKNKGRYMLDVGELALVREVVYLFIEKKMGSFGFDPDNEGQFFFSLNDLLYFLLPSEIQAYTNELFQEIKETDVEMFEETNVFEEVVLRSKKCLLIVKQFVGLIPNENPTMRQYSLQSRKYFEELLEDLETTKSELNKFILKLEWFVSEMEYRFRKVFEVWRRKKENK